MAVFLYVATWWASREMRIETLNGGFVLRPGRLTELWSVREVWHGLLVSRVARLTC